MLKDKHLFCIILKSDYSDVMENGLFPNYIRIRFKRFLEPKCIWLTDDYEKSIDNLYGGIEKFNLLYMVVKVSFTYMEYIELINYSKARKEQWIQFDDEFLCLTKIEPENISYFNHMLNYTYNDILVYPKTTIIQKIKSWFTL